MTKESFEFETPAYTRGSVIRMLMHYGDMRASVLGGQGTPMKTIYKQSVKYTFAERPLGASSSYPWPFMHKPHAQSSPNGKKRARMSEDVMCALIDLEDALDRLHERDFHLIYEYYILGGITLDELAARNGLKSRGRLHERLQRIVKRMTNTMNGVSHEQ